jgi:sugar-phosphatase
MKIQFECSAILFDLDGVLVDSTRSVTRQWRMWAVEKGLDPDEVVRMAHGVRTIEVIRKMAPHLPLEEETRKLEKREADDIEGVAVMPGAADLLRSIPENRWCVVTSGTRYLATSRLRFGNLPIPKVMVTADEVSQGKPHPEPYLTGAKLLGFAPEKCLVIEDAPAGIRSAHAGGMKVIALPSTYPVAELRDADVVTDALAAIAVDRNGREGLTVNVG